MAETLAPKAPVLQPYWKCLYGELFRQDPTHPLIKHAYFVLYILLHLPVIFPKSFGKWLFDFPESYFSFDETFLPEHHSSQSVLFLKLVSLTTGLSYSSIFICFTITIAAFAALIWTDMTTKRRPFTWPKNWETDNNACYDDMFCEPTRKDRVIRRPGNTLSNFLYLMLAFVILSSAVSRGVVEEEATSPPLIRGMLLSDFIFGLMLLILSISSIIWHSCNAFWSHGGRASKILLIICYIGSLAYMFSCCYCSYSGFMVNGSRHHISDYSNNCSGCICLY